MIKQRDFFTFLIFGFLTCGIYWLFFFYSMNEDINRMCNDGRDTPDYLLVLLLSFFTCGIYNVYWYYLEGQRLHNNAHKYGLMFEENGVTVLLWYVIGLLLCGTGPIIASYFLIKNTNEMAATYNNGQMGGTYNNY